MAISLASDPAICERRRLALILSNGAYTQRAPLSRPVMVGEELRRKLAAMGFEVVGADDQNLAGMREATARWLKLVGEAADSIQSLRDKRSRDLGLGETDGSLGSGRSGVNGGSCGEPPLLLFFAFCGHGRDGRFFPVDMAKGAPPEEMYCFFEDLLFRLYEVLGGGDVLRRVGVVREHRERSVKRPSFLPESPRALESWRLPGAAVISVIESCRRLSSEEQAVFDDQRARISAGRRHMLPSLLPMRPELSNMGGAEFDAARLGFLGNLGAGAPRLLLALSSESTTPSYDVVFLRSITEAIDKPVRIWGILERAALDTLRRTGHKQRPVLLDLSGTVAPGGESAKDLVAAGASRRRWGDGSGEAIRCRHPTAPSGGGALLGLAMLEQRPLVDWFLS
eukprot:TRINITY_DN22319_c0_g1_i1.p1 TRINITY_DN22319_c0_g1~~TRINITY_DN22319_c0_g1_i1.p1  ORF type:complete len:420 (-),score=90.45 TRINITY_DN22319_c0_g1_i1:212-1399(-)